MGRDDSMLSVQLLDHMGDDLAVANAARVSMAKESSYWMTWSESTETATPSLRSEDAKLIYYLAKHRHWTPFSQTAVKFRCSAPIFLARQLFKHKVGLTENEVSRRYVDDEPKFFKPEAWRRRAPNVKQGSLDEKVYFVKDQFNRMWSPEQLWDDHCKASLDLYNNMLLAGVCPEQARMVLPQGMMTEWIWTGNVASFARIFHQRSDSHAQVEAQQFAKLLGEHMANLFPTSWSALTQT